MNWNPAVAAFAFLTLAVVPAQGATIFAVAAGNDTHSTPDMYEIAFTSGAVGEFVASVSIDLGADPDAFFDFDAIGSFAGATSPVFGAMGGLVGGDITPVFGNFIDGDPQHPSLLTFNFLAGSFGIGDFFRFAADTDFFVSEPAPGSAFGEAPAVFSVVLQGGAAGSDAFDVVNISLSFARVTITPSAPEPATLVLLGLGAGAVARRRRR
jgi:hypothetical protein